MIGLDTNILLRWLLDDSAITGDAPGQVEHVARIILESGETFFVNNIVLAETVWVLRNRGGQSRKTIQDILHQLLASANVTMEDEQTIRRALDAYVVGNADFADYLIGETNRAAGCSTTFTFDRKAARHPAFSTPEE
ncbi:MAG: type II toxin-antitoxin system VapC family toxin [Maricaulaceae bacterium]|nr:type II toxin-antitoxin system VapC family toxin [Maricaulaceae bacterium]